MKFLTFVCLILIAFSSYLAYSNVQLARENGQYQTWFYMLQKHIEAQEEGKQGT